MIAIESPAIRPESSLTTLLDILSSSGKKRFSSIIIIKFYCFFCRSQISCMQVPVIACWSNTVHSPAPIVCTLTPNT